MPLMPLFSWFEKPYPVLQVGRSFPLLRLWCTLRVCEVLFDGFPDHHYQFQQVRGPFHVPRDAHHHRQPHGKGL